MPRTRLNRSSAAAATRRAEPTPTVLCDAIDRVLNVGVAARGDVVLSVADVPLVKLSLGVLLASVETAEGRGDRGQCHG